MFRVRGAGLKQLAAHLSPPGLARDPMRCSTNLGVLLFVPGLVGGHDHCCDLTA